MMSNKIYVEQVIRGAKEIEVALEIWNEQDSRDLIKSMYKAFTPTGSQNWTLWDRPPEHRGISVSIQDASAWHWIQDFVQSRSCLLIIEPRFVFEFTSGADVVKAIGETSIPGFYITDKTVSYALCMNHHDFLIAFGTAIQWLEAKKS